MSKKMNRYEEAVDVLARFMSDMQSGLTRYKTEQIHNAIKELQSLAENPEQVKDEDFQAGKEATVRYLVNNGYIRYGFDADYLIERMKRVKRG